MRRLAVAPIGVIAFVSQVVLAHERLLWKNIVAGIREVARFLQFPFTAKALNNLSDERWV